MSYLSELKYHQSESTNVRAQRLFENECTFVMHEKKYDSLPSLNNVYNTY